MKVLKDFQESKESQHDDLKGEEVMKIVDLENENDSKINTDDGGADQDGKDYKNQIQKLSADKSGALEPNYSNPFGPNKARKETER